MENQLGEDFKKIISQFNKNLEKLLPEIEKETNNFVSFIQHNKLDYLIKKENLNKEYLSNFNNIVERELDFLMNPFTAKYFHKLLFYWEELNPESANDYKRIFKETFEEESIPQPIIQFPTKIL